MIRVVVCTVGHGRGGLSEAGGLLHAESGGRAWWRIERRRGMSKRGLVI